MKVHLATGLLVNVLFNSGSIVEASPQFSDILAGAWVSMQRESYGTWGTDAMVRRSSSILKRLRTATRGLTYPSETDAPITPKRYKKLSPDDLDAQSLLEATGHDADTPVEEISPEAFFKPVLAVEDWYGSEELEMVERYRALADLVESELEDVRVFRVGARKIDVYLIGCDPAGRLIALHTWVVET